MTKRKKCSPCLKSADRSIEPDLTARSASTYSLAAAVHDKYMEQSNTLLEKYQVHLATCRFCSLIVINTNFRRFYRWFYHRKPGHSVLFLQRSWKCTVQWKSSPPLVRCRVITRRRTKPRIPSSTYCFQGRLKIVSRLALKLLWAESVSEGRSITNSEPSPKHSRHFCTTSHTQSFAFYGTLFIIRRSGLSTIPLYFDCVVVKTL